MNATQAAEHIRRMAIQYEAMVSAADVLEQIGSLDNAIAERQAKLMQLSADTKTALENLQAIIAEGDNHITLANNEARAIVDAADAEAAEARSKVQSIMRQAEHDAAEKVRAASDAAAAKTGAAASELASLRAQIDEAKAARANAEAEAQKAMEQAETAKATLADIKKRIANVAAM